MKTRPRELWRKTRWAIKSAIDVANLPKLRAGKRRLDAMIDMPTLLKAICRKRGKDYIVADQVISEIAGLCDLLAQRPPGVVVEIGTAKGGSLYLWSRLARPEALLVSIDKPGEMGSVRAVNRSVYRTFGRERGMKVHTLPVDSHSRKVHARLQHILAGRKVDFLFIDGDHSFAGVKADFDGYLPYMAPDGMIALHDIAIPPGDSWIRVPEFWREIKDRDYRTQTFVAEQGEVRGIGVVLLGG